MRKLFLIFTAMLLCSISVFAQITPEQPNEGNGTEGNHYKIDTPAEFLWITNDNDAHYELTADINLGDFGDITSAIIPTFYGTFDGGGHTITYQASFIGTTKDGNYALFGLVAGGTLENINVNADVTISGTEDDMQVALLCGKFTNQIETSSGSNPVTYSYTYSYDGVIRNCNVNGNINSTVSSSNGGGTDAGLLVGESQGRIEYCNGNGNVRGLGYVGGLIGQMSGYKERHQEPIIQGFWYRDVYSDNTDYESSVIGSSFTGTVIADSPSKDHNDPQYGSFAGGICGFAHTNTEITFCYVSASINLGNHKEGINNEESGIASTALSGGSGSPTVTNNYAEGTINGVPMEDVACGGITNSAGNTSYNYYPGGSTTNEGEGDCITDEMDSEEIAEALNNAAENAGESENIHFSPVGDDNVIFGQISKVCEAPTNLTITNNEGTYTATWQSANADNTIEEATWHWELTGGNLNVALQESITTTTISSTLDPSPNPYTFTVYTDCSAFDTENSQSVSSTFTVACPTPTNLTASNITDNGFKISWTANVDCQLTVNGNNYEISAGNPMTKQITGLDPQTQYTAIVKAKCGNEYVEQASINVTTARLAAPTGLAVNTVWNGSEGSGTATITWDMVDGLTYEIEGQTGDKERGFAITGLAENNYTLRLRAKKGTKTSDWVSMPYTISSPDAPKNPQVTYTINGDAYDVTVSWTAGSTENDGWKVNGGEVQNTASYVLTAQTPGYVTTLSIVEKVGESTSGALQVPIQVPCLPATLPNAVSTTQTSATFTFSQAIANRKVIIGSDEYEASATSITIDELTSGTTYSYEVREYCNGTQYSSVIANFATVGCFAVKNLSVSDIGVTNATISWESQSTLAGLNYQITVNGETKPEQTARTITLTGLTSATGYTIVVKEQCGEDWGEERTITFTTESGNYVTAKDGDFDFPDTWDGNKVPTGNFGNITIKHNVTLSHSLTLSGSCRISNEGVLKITSQGELINTTGNNVGGIVEVETPQKDMDKWTFIGAPFENYKLECIKPVSGSDISVSLYDYVNNKWSDEWAHYNTTVGRGDGYFAWPFYKGVVTYTTYGDLFDWNADGTSGTIMTSYDFSQPAKYQLNNAETFTVTKNVQEGNGGRWMALANPYPAKLSVDKFVAANNTNIASGSEVSGNTTIQGKCIYKLTNNVSSDNSNQQAWDVVFANNANEKVKDIAMTEGFFVNLASGNQVTFSKTQLTNNPTQQAKSQVAPREFVELSLVKGNHKSKLYFAHNQEAEQNYDIFDANKLFAIGEIAEPYFVTEGIALVKEEVKELPYYATMNVRSYKDDTVSFVVKNIPKDMSVFIIDNEEEIKMSEDVAYTTHISEGENADRFQVLFKKASVIEEAKDSEITITNTNRLVRVESTQTDLRIEVYNALGQKVFATNDYNFTLNEVSAGTYMIKAYNRITTQTAKIVVE